MNLHQKIRAYLRKNERTFIEGDKAYAIAADTQASSIIRELIARLEVANVCGKRFSEGGYWPINGLTSTVLMDVSDLTKEFKHD